MKLVPLLTISLLLLPNLARAASFTPFGGISEALPVSSGRGVSPDGEVAVGTASGTVGEEAFRWQTGATTGLGSIPGYLRSQALDASADGTVVVGGVQDDAANVQAFRWTGGVMTGLGFLAGDSRSWASGVSADGGVVVGYGDYEAFRWENGTMIGLGLLPDGTYSYATGVSADGAVVVGSADDATRYSAAFRWSNGVLSSLSGFPAEVIESAPYGVSGDGAFVVGEMRDSALSEAFRWSEGEVLALGFLHDWGTDSHSVATAISDDGTVVVGRSVDGDETLQAFVWTETSGMQRLIDLLAARGATGFEGWELYTVDAVSADGTRIVGTGVNPDGFVEGFIADISVPEPSAVWLMGAALAALVCARRRTAT